MNDEDMGPQPSHHEEGAAEAQAADDSSQDMNMELGMDALLRDSDFAFRSVRRGETVEGTIVRVDQDEVLVDIGLKSEGVISSREMYSDPDAERPLAVGDRALVYVMQPENQEGHAVLSLRRAQAERSWRDVEEIYQEGGVIEAPVVDFNKGGLIVDVRGIRGFVPVSQVLDLRNVSRQEGDNNDEVNNTLSQMQGRKLPLKVIEINRSRNRLILSERAAAQERRTQRKDFLIDQLEPGQVRTGTVSNLTSFGAFVDLGGADGLVHVSELSYNRVNHPGEILHVGQEISVYVLSVDRDSKKIALSLKRAQADPWTTVEERYHVGEVVPATITKLAKFGAFAKVQEGLEGLIHTSELTDLPVQDPSQVVHENQDVNVKIIHINSQRRRLGLSVRQAEQPESEVQNVGDFDDSGYPSDAETQEDSSNTIGSNSPEFEQYAGEVARAAAAAELESQLEDSDETGAAAVASESVSPAEPEDESTNEVDTSEPPVASAASHAPSQE